MYFARPDSIIDSISVAISREKMGIKLAHKIKSVVPEDELSQIDVVIPIPETAITSAQAIQKTLKIPMAQGFVKNRYV